MKVAAFNGSPKREGNTYHAIRLAADELEREGIEVEIIHVGNTVVQGCLACGTCGRNRNERCVIDDDVNGWIQKMKEADGIILGSPVYYAGLNGTMKAFLDRAFFTAGASGGLFRYKVGAAVTAVRRTGGIPAMEQIHKYFSISEMLIATSNYWNVIHGGSPGEVLKDGEGVQLMQVLGRNMAWLMKLIENGRGRVQKPERIKKVYTNFVR